MPAISNHAIELGNVALRARDWSNTVGQSGMTPTAFAFLIPVFVVAIAAPILCMFCIRKRRQVVPAVRPARAAKKPALRRAEARERLDTVTEVSNLTSNPSSAGSETTEVNDSVETQSVLERECAICLSTLHAPAPPEPVKLSEEPVTDEAAKPPSVKDVATAEPEAILKLHVCQHEFHAECLVSWFVLRKTSCPICRAVYYSKEAMQEHDDEEAAQLAALSPVPDPAEVEAQAPPPAIRNWRYFLHGQSVVQSQSTNINAIELRRTQPIQPTILGVGPPTMEELASRPLRTPPPSVTQTPPRAWWQRLRGEL